MPPAGWGVRAYGARIPGEARFQSCKRRCTLCMQSRTLPGLMHQNPSRLVCKVMVTSSQITNASER
eukprot:2542241-Rhodomonas_salina.1